MKVLTIVGARPQFVKSAPVSAAMQRSGAAEIVVHTGQHYDNNMSDVFFEELGLRPPDHHLGIGSGSHGSQTGRMLEAVERVVLVEAPDWVLVYGDTNSTLAGALAAAKLHVRIAHVEAGLRSFKRTMPEEINRIMTDHVSTLLFAPTETAVANLRREGFGDMNIARVGDVMFDAALMFATRAAERSRAIERLRLAPKSYVLATIHRAENTDTAANLSAIMTGLTQVCADVPVVLPLHPRTRKHVDRAVEHAFVKSGGILVEPVGYLDMVMLESNAAVIATDSGGVQKEAFFYRVPCVTLRDETEWVELLDLGWNALVPPIDPEAIRRAVLAAVGREGAEASPYGTGKAAEIIVERLQAFGREGAPSAACGDGRAAEFIAERLKILR
jgi:UDP-GlcNAc3NAcA epimerase